MKLESVGIYHAYSKRGIHCVQVKSARTGKALRMILVDKGGQILNPRADRNETYPYMIRYQAPLRNGHSTLTRGDIHSQLGHAEADWLIRILPALIGH